MVDLVKLEQYGAEMRDIRGREIAMVFQEPMTSLNPLYTIGDQIADTQAHRKVGRKEALDRALKCSIRCRSALKQRLNEYQHQLSGGMRQR